jgi:mannose-1-phosphate guanylyltransferase
LVASFILEPFGRNTSATIVAAAFQVVSTDNIARFSNTYGRI